MIKARIQKSHNFDEVIEWLFKNIPKDLDADRWHLNDEINSIDGDELFLSEQHTYVVFKDERDYIMFTLRWA